LIASLLQRAPRRFESTSPVPRFEHPTELHRARAHWFRPRRPSREATCRVRS
jgi:hypothetical protein